MIDRERLIRLIADTVEGYRTAMHGSAETVGPETRLFGPSGALDSLGLVSVLVEIEQRVADAEGRAVSLMDDRAMSQASSPFRTVATLADYLLRQIAPE